MYYKKQIGILKKIGIRKVLRDWVFTFFGLSFANVLLVGVHLDNFISAIIASILLSILNVYLKPFIVVALLPLIVITLGIGYILTNALTLYLVSLMGVGLSLNSFLWAIPACIIVSILTNVADVLFPERSFRPYWQRRFIFARKQDDDFSSRQFFKTRDVENESQDENETSTSSKPKPLINGDDKNTIDV